MWPFLVLRAFGGEQSLYDRALTLIEANYLRHDEIDQQKMFLEAAEQLEQQIEWLIVTPGDSEVGLKDGSGRWQQTVRLESPGELPAALARLEAAIRGAPSPVDADLDISVELLKGVVRTLDRHSAVLHGEGLERFDERLSGTLTGVGCTISRDDAGLYIKDLVSGAAAERAGVTREDRLIRIDGVSTVGMTTEDATGHIRGPAETPVVLTVARDDATLDIPILRERIVLPNVEASVGPNGVGVIRIDHFTERTKADLVGALAQLGEESLSKGLILDLRGNTGGSLGQSAQAADVFVGSGLIVSTSGHTGRPVPGLIARIEALADSPGYTMPIVVLQDRATASGSEILGGALAHLDRAVLVGERSFGKGTVQKLYPLDSDIKLKLTVAEYVLADDTRVADVGLSPDLPLDGVEFEENGVWYPARERTPGALQVVGEQRAIEIAARLLGTSVGPSRGALLRAIEREQTSVAAEEQRLLSARFTQFGVDWRVGPPPAEAAAVEVEWRWSTPPTAGQSSTLTATVHNFGPPLYQAAIRLRSTNESFDEAILPIGYLESGGTQTASTTFRLARGASERADQVEQLLEASGIATIELPPQHVLTQGAGPSAVSLTLRARAVDREGFLPITIDLTNRGDRMLTGLVARFDFPEVDGIELREAHSTPKSVAARATDRVELGVRVSPAWTHRELPLHLVLTDDAGARVAEYDLRLPRGGRAVSLAAPELQIELPPLQLTPGATVLRIRATDDRSLDHVVVYAGTERMNRARARPFVIWERDKVAWRPARGGTLKLEVEVPVVLGTNRYTVVAKDVEGFKTVRDVFVLGQDAEATAEGTGPPGE